MKIGFIIVLYKTPEKEVGRLRLEVGSFQFNNYKLYFIDNSFNNHGYAEGVNEGIKKALKDNCGLLIVANPDISTRNLAAKELLDGAKHFDIWGLAMKQQRKIYYGGEIDPWRLTGGLITLKPKTRFQEVDFVSGSLMLFKKEVTDKIGYFSQDYFMYYEDVDYCYRARKTGFKVGIDNKSSYDHFEVSSKNPQKEQYLLEARKIFFKKYSSIWQKIYALGRLPKTLLEGILRLTPLAQEDKKPQLRFFVNFASLNVSSLINKLLNFFLFIFLIRYLRPSDYGIYTLVWAQVSLFSPIVDLGTTSYGIVNLPSEKKQKFISLFNLRLAVSIVVFFLTFFISILMFKGNSRLISFIFLTSFVIFSNMFSGGYLIKNALEGKLYNSSLISVIFNILLILTLCFFTILFRSLPVIFLLIFIFYNLYSLVNYFLIKKNLMRFSFTIDLIAWKNLIGKSYVYVLIGFLAGLYFKIDVFLLQIIKGEEVVGIYSAGFKFFEGMMFIAASYNISRIPIFAKLIKKGIKVLVKSMKKDIILLGALGFVIAIFSFYLSPIVLPFFLKSNYHSSITVVRLTMFALPFILVSSVFLNAIYVLKKANIIIFIFLFQLFINFILNIIFIPKYSYVASSYITVISEIINVMLLVTAFQFIKKRYEKNIA